MVIFRENTEDIYAGIEFKEGTEEVKKLLTSYKMKWVLQIFVFSETSGIGIKPVSKEGTERLVKISYSICN